MCRYCIWRFKSDSKVTTEDVESVEVDYVTWRCLNEFSHGIGVFYAVNFVDGEPVDADLSVQFATDCASG